MQNYFHSVTLDEETCRGCTNCIKRCPTEAIRVRKSKARIIKERCIDCGECIRVCPYHAKKAITDSMEILKNFKYKIALPAPALYGQFNLTYSRKRILSALKLIGFDDVYEVAKAAEFVTEATKKFIKKGNYKKPIISSACPAVVRLIQVRFPNLIDNILRIASPMEVAARMAKAKAQKQYGFKEGDVGVFFITPCAAKVTSVKAPYETDKSLVDGAISMKDIYLKLLDAMKDGKVYETLEQAGMEGIRWASSGGESSALGIENYLAVDGIHNVIRIFEEIENERLEDIDFVEALACTGGCLGGPLTVENAYLSRRRLKKHMEEAEKMLVNTGITSDTDVAVVAAVADTGTYATAGTAVTDVDSGIVEDKFENFLWTGDIEHRPIMKLDEDLTRAIKKLETLEKLNDELPGLDCGACGAPSCRALAEDIVRGNANETDCIFKLRERVRSLAVQMAELEAKMPPVLDKDGNKSSKLK
ncbi:MAG: 4Fe-4S dicluster domain-containing protein [Firmicutes bacterium]|nr:4Fe-4S dicluster domain-containing protein [Bacillota bacterium]